MAGQISMVLAFLCIACQASLVGSIQSAFKLDMKEPHFQVSSSSNMSSRIGEDHKGTGERQLRISPDGHISSGFGKDQKQPKDPQLKVSSKDRIYSPIAEECPVDETAQLDLTVITTQTEDDSFPGVEWKVVFFAKKKIIKGKRVVQFQKNAGSDKWVIGECWMQGQYASDKCAANNAGECSCKTEFYSRNLDDWTLAEEPCVTEWPPGEIQVGTQFTAVPGGDTTVIPIVVTSVSKLSDYGEHPDGCPKRAIMDTGEANRKKFQFLWKAPDELIVLSPGFICDEGYHMTHFLEGSSSMCDDEGANCRFGMVDAAELTCNPNTNEWENFPTCVMND